VRGLLSPANRPAWWGRLRTPCRRSSTPHVQKKSYKTTQAIRVIRGLYVHVRFLDYTNHTPAYEGYEKISTVIVFSTVRISPRGAPEQKCE
jgi:hypothetical protein